MRKTGGLDMCASNCLKTTMSEISIKIGRNWSQLVATTLCNHMQPVATGSVAVCHILGDQNISLVRLHFKKDKRTGLDWTFKLYLSLDIAGILFYAFQESREISHIIFVVDFRCPAYISTCTRRKCLLIVFTFCGYFIQ